MIDTLKLGQRIRIRRNQHGLSMQELADAVGRSKTWIADLEKGRHLPTSPKLLQSLAFALRDDWTLLQTMAWEERDQEEQEFEGDKDNIITGRAKPKSFRALDRGAEECAFKLHAIEIEEGEAIPVMWALDHAGDTGEMLGLPYPLKFKTFKWEHTGDEEGRSYFKDDVFWIELRDDVAERAREGSGRDRFTAAHELGHIVEHQDLLIEESPKARFRDWATTTRGPSKIKVYEDPEWQANVWASSYLMPCAAIVAYVRRQKDYDFSIEGMADHFKVSAAAAKIRIEKVQARLVREMSG